MASLILTLAAVSGCGDRHPTAVTMVHVGVEPDGAPGLFGRPRVQIGNESRYVLGNHPLVPLRVRESVRLPADPTTGSYAIEAPLPTALLDAGAIRVDAWLSTRPPGDKPANVVEAREGRRQTVETAPVIHVRTPEKPLPATLHMAVPLAPDLAGLDALVTMVARRLPETSTEHFTTREVDVPAGARLAFGFAVEPPGWAEGWPPVRFRLFADADGKRIGPLFERTIDPAADPRDRRWRDANVDLQSCAGRKVRFTFETEALTGDAAAGATVDRSFSVVSTPLLYHPGQPAADPLRNVILVSLDTLRAIELGTYGQLRPLTPAIDRRVADAGTVMQTAISPAPYTPPAHMSMFTGLLPCRHRVLGVHTRLAPEHVTLAERLRLAGYHTAAFTEDAYLIAASGFERGFDTYSENRSDESASPGFAVETFDAASRWLATNDAEPFFLFVHTYQVHEPYAPPRAYQELFRENAANEKMHNLDNYDREVRYTDELFGGLLDAIDAKGLADRTVLVVTADHGEGFGEHFWTGHGRDAHDEAIHVPLLVRSPGLVPAGRRVPEMVGLIDIAPTVLDLLHLAPLDNVDGRSFSSLLNGPGPKFAERPLTSFGFGDEAGLTVVGAVRTRTHKFIRFLNPPVTRFYDLEKDPIERVELPSDGDPIATDLRQQLDAATAVCEKSHEPGLATERPVEIPDWFANREQMDEALQKLKSLGYVQ